MGRECGLLRNEEVADSEIQIQDIKGEGTMKLKIVSAMAVFLFPVVSAFAQTKIDDIVGAGTTNYVPVFTGSHRIGNSNIFQTGGNVGIGNPTPLWPVHITSNRTIGAGGYPPIAVWAESSAPDTWGGVYAVASSGTGNTIALNGEAYSPTGTGVVGQGGSQGVVGATSTTDGFASGVHGVSAGTAGPAVAVFGEALSPQGIAGLFINRPGGDILQGRVNTVDLTVFRVDGSGTVYANGGFQPSGADFAESLPVVGDRTKYSAGDLLVIDSAVDGYLALAQQPYSSLVAGIYSTKPGILGSTRQVDETPSNSDIPLAVLGVVPCKVSAENGPIQVGDLLVTSSTPGHAMRGTDRSRMLGAVVGKALEPLQRGTGVIRVLVTLQ